MRKQIRQGVFETNSSSVHSLTIITEKQYNEWKNGELYFDTWENGFVKADGKIKEEHDNTKYSHFETEQEFWDELDYEYYSFVEHFETPSGDKMVAFGYYGENR